MRFTTAMEAIYTIYSIQLNSILTKMTPNMIRKQDLQQGQTNSTTKLETISGYNINKCNI